MKTIFSIVFFFLLSAYVTPNQVRAAVSDSSEPMDEHKLSKTVVRVARGYVVAKEHGTTFFIDYRNGTLLTLVKETQVCRRFDILTSPQGDKFTKGKNDLFSEIEFIKEDTTQEEKDPRYSTIKVMYAPRAMRLRGVTSATFEQFGITFTPGVTEYVVDGNHWDFNLFVEAAKYNAGLGQLNPLIFQLDVTHLFSHFSGVPVRKKDKTGATVLSFSLEKEEILRELLPQACSLE